MLLDFNDLSHTSIQESGITILGAGAAGLTLAQELSKQGLHCTVFESGGLSYDQSIQNLYKGTTTDLGYPLQTSRSRYFGGSTNCWAGITTRLDPLDFERRSYLAHSGWPITYQELVPYYENAERLVKELFTEPSRENSLPSQKSLTPTLESKLFRIQPFRYLNRKEVMKSDNKIKVYLHSTVTKIVLNPDSSRVQELIVTHSYSGESIKVVPKIVVCALGGIENPRLLLHSNVGNNHDLVGRFFMEHPHFESLARILEFDNKLAAYKMRPDYLIGLTISEAIKREQHLLNATFFKRSPARIDQPDSEGIVALTDRLGITKTSELFHLGIPAEQSPHPENRVALGNQRDRLGMPEVELRWKLFEQDIDSLRRSNLIFAREISAHGFGRCELMFQKAERLKAVPEGNHHMGTTRMAESEKNGVVDKNGKIFGVSNLYVAGSSLFPTSGAANPTLTIMALCLRLADHLKERHETT